MNQNLDSFKEQAQRAYYWTSFSPERRGESTVSEAQAELDSDIEELKAGGAEGEIIDSYIERFKRYFGAWLGAKSRCMSSMITGPARFPTRRAEKANRSEHNHYVVFQEWRKKAVKSIIRKAQPEKTYSSELERYQADLEQRKALQERMKNINAGYRLFKRFPLMENAAWEKKFSEADLKIIKNYVPQYSFQPVPFAQYQLQNNLANIKRIEGRIAELSKKEEAKVQAGGEKEFPFEGGVVVLNYEIDRVQIKFPGKPSAEKISELKKNGFKWAPSQMAWQRQLTQNGIWAAAHVTGLNSSNLK